jgi:hypothetical protein
MDGANCGISFNPDGELLLQSRGHYLTGGGREKHFTLFKQMACFSFARWRSPLASDCLSTTTKRGRTITRDEYEEVRERTAARMSLESSRELFRRRSWIAETPFGILKSVMGVRQFLLRGLENTNGHVRPQQIAPAATPKNRTS